MYGNHDERERPAQPGEPDESSPSGRAPVYFRPRPHSGQFTLRERAAHSVAWPLDTDEYLAFEATRNLEQVGHILRRLELDQADIVQLRTETRAILAGLAA